METNITESQNMELAMKLSYKDVYEKCHELVWRQSIKPNAKIYGVPKGGLIPASYVARITSGILVDDPSEADYIIDDLIDSGATKERYSKYQKPFYGIFEKTNEWIEFPWEINEAPAEDGVQRILSFLGEDVRREGLVETPKRHIKYLKEFLSPPDFNVTVFDSESFDEMIVVKDIEFYSICEHHLLPFFGIGTIAYIPSDKIVGISKLPRILEKFSRRLQNQERITKEVAEFISEKLNPKGVGVILKARHTCMEMRGVKKKGETITSFLTGVFKTDEKCRNEFMKFS